MFKSKCTFVLLLSCTIFDSSVNAVSLIKPCKPDDKECITSSAQAAVPIVAAGIPELGLKTADPIKIDYIASDDAGLKLIFTNIDIAGVSKSKIISIERDPLKKIIKADIECPIDAKGQYDLSGKLLFLEAKGNGDFSIKTDKLLTHVTLKYKLIEKNGQQYWKINGYDYSYDFVSKIHIKLHNLFGGNKQLAEPVENLLDQEWETLIDTIGGPFMSKVLGEFVDVIRKLFLAIPSNELEIV